MADITMCKGTEKEAFPISYEIGLNDFECPLRHSCLRHKANPNEHWQSYLVGIPYDRDKEVCEHYWRIKKT